MAKIAQRDHETDVAAEQGRKTLTAVARRAAEPGADAAGEISRVARTAAPSEEAREAAREATQETEALGTSVLALVSEQTRHSIQAATALGRARTFLEVAQVQSEFIGGSFERMSRFNDRYFALVRGGMTTLSSPSRR